MINTRLGTVGIEWGFREVPANCQLSPCALAASSMPCRSSRGMSLITAFIPPSVTRTHWPRGPGGIQNVGVCQVMTLFFLGSDR